MSSLAMAITVRHVTRFVYDKDAYESHNDVRLHPFDDQFQKCVLFKLTVEPEETVVPFTDYFGNRGHSISIHRPHDALTIAAESVIEKIAEAIEPAKDVIFNDFLRDDVVQTERAYEFLGESRYIQFSSRLRSFFWMARPRPMEGVTEY